MFERSDRPRVFGVAPGVDFADALVQGLIRRNSGKSPEAMARIDIIVNTRRTQRRIVSLFDAGPAQLQPRIRLVSDPGWDPLVADLGPETPPLRRRLELSRLVSRLIDNDPSLAPRTAVFDLAESLAALIDEMQGEGRGPDDLDRIDTGDMPGHWGRSKKFIEIVSRFSATGEEPPGDPEARRRHAVERLDQLWRTAPPEHPVLVAGSTGSRGTTALLMRAVARLPQGALILPGFDFDLPAEIWEALCDPMSSQDHPQYRFAALMRQLNIRPEQVENWGGTPPHPDRNRLVSLALRPAPVTDQWMAEGPGLGPLEPAVRAVSLVEAPGPRIEALAIALRLRAAIETGETAALISPDRMLTRQVAAALDRWGVEPDDSAGQPLALSAPGRFLRHIAALLGRQPAIEDLLVVLKHPITNSGSDDRGQHLLWTRELELFMRERGVRSATRSLLRDWAQKETGGAALRWADWLADCLLALDDIDICPIADHLDRLIGAAEALARGPGHGGSGRLWDGAAGIEAARLISALRAEANRGDPCQPAEFYALINSLLNTGEVRDPVQPHPRIKIWGTLEARVQQADIVILGGLNDGVWPPTPTPDPWLNRRMRHDAGLLLPDRQIGLSAHDFQQAIAAREVVLTRSVRDTEAETVASRWLNRLVSLLDGLSGSGGATALSGMRERGGHWIELAQALDHTEKTQPPAQRPAPCPPADKRPAKLSVTQIQTLIRDPYAIYGREILNLRPVPPLRFEPDAAIRGTIFHKIFELFIKESVDQADTMTEQRLLAIADQVLEARAPWPVARRMWRAHLARIAGGFLMDEARRASRGRPRHFEISGAFEVPGVRFALTAKADRIDELSDGRIAIYDYKTGQLPTRAQIRHFDKQLLLEAIMAEAGAFEGLPATGVALVGYIGLGSSPGTLTIALGDDADQEFRLDEVLAGLRRLIGAYADPGRGYASRRSMFKMRFDGDYDHLARYGEWSDADTPRRVRLT